MKIPLHIAQYPWIRILALLGLFLAPASRPAIAQSAPAPEKKRLCIGPIVAIKSAAQKALKAGQSDTLQQTIETLDTTLIDQVNSSRKFEVVARKDTLKSLINEQELGDSGNVDPATAAQALKLAGAQYLMFTTVTDFTMGKEQLNFQAIGATANREAIRVNCSIQIYDTTTGKLIESAKFRGEETYVSRDGSVTADGMSLTKITDRLSAEILSHLIDVIYPAKVAAKMGTQITINRGEGAGVKVGEVWTVFALGDEITDPDTGEKLGRNEAEIGTITISRVTAKLSYGEASEDNGIAVGNVVRRKQTDLAAAAAKDAQPTPEKSLSEKVKNDY